MSIVFGRQEQVLSIDIDSLNPPQREAVLCVEGPLLVLAGAGSGKTRVLTYRIAHIIDSLGVGPWEILAITFTNKAASEMRERLSALIGTASRGMWVSTFHSMCIRILRADADRLGFAKNFTICATDDQKKLVKNILLELNLNIKAYQPNMILSKISNAKNELIGPEEFETVARDPVSKAAAKVYKVYQRRLRASNSMDFDDMLFYAHMLLRDNPDILDAYQDRFKYILVDEYQDTNHAQYSICSLLAAKRRNIMVVGDDDQSIYSWRGADIKNILEFEHEYPDATVIKLEQNYRSTGNILGAANALIANNKNRKSKKLFTDQGSGEKIDVYAASDERDEGRWVAGILEKLHGAGCSYDEMAVFYRTNAQSRVLEDMLLRAGTPYRIVGGTRFFDRAEIRDVMAYLSLVVNPQDDLSFDRIINVPKRGIGKSTVDRIASMAEEMGMCHLEAAETLLAYDDVRPAVKKSIGQFVQLIKQARSYSGNLRSVVERIVDDADLIGALEAEGSDESLGRVENIKEFFGVVEEFSQTHDESGAFFEAPTADGEDAQAQPTKSELALMEESLAEEQKVNGEFGRLESTSTTIESGEAGAPERVLLGDSLADFLEWAHLRTDLDTEYEDGSSVTLMTVHSSKGLEFDHVIVTGMEQSIFPHGRSIESEAAMEEERRLAYVAITRARKHLYLTYAMTRRLFGQESSNRVSEFIREIPSEFRKGSGLGSSSYSGTGWEKRGSRRGISGSGTEAGEGRVFGSSSASGSRRKGASSSSIGSRRQEKSDFAKGDTVDHKTFGRGVVIKVDGDTVHVKFAKSGQVKKLLKDFAPMVKIAHNRK